MEEIRYLLFGQSAFESFRDTRSSSGRFDRFSQGDEESFKLLQRIHPKLATNHFGQICSRYIEYPRHNRRLHAMALYNAFDPEYKVRFPAVQPGILAIRDP